MRLSLDNLAAVPTEMRPGYDPRNVGIGALHIGVGAFHRAHQATYTDAVLASLGGDWGICGVSQRSRDVPDQLEPQDGLYTLLECGPSGRLAGVKGAIREVFQATAEPERLMQRFADPRIHVVTLTVSEKGYRVDATTGRLVENDPEIVLDLTGRPPRTVPGQITRGLLERYRGGGDPLAVISCDNFPANGPLLARLIKDMAERMSAATDDFRAWIETAVTFPATMVDRIVPATTAADRVEVEELIGMADHGVVVAEPFSQWIIEDRFRGPRPAWESVGATITDANGVRRYERLKLRVLNGMHSALAYLGALSGHRFVADAVADDDLRAVLRRLISDDVSPTLDPPPGVDTLEYGEAVLERFANPHLAYRTEQVASDGSQKLPQRLLGTARDRIATGATPRWVALAVAGWMWYLSGPSDLSEDLSYSDPIADELKSAAIRVGRDAKRLAETLLRFESVFGTDLPEAPEFVGAIVTWLRDFSRHGVGATLRSAVEEYA